MQDSLWTYSQKQEAFILDETRKDSKVVEKKWKNERKLKIIVLIIIILIIISLAL